jgi:hypothetical protein
VHSGSAWSLQARLPVPYGSSEFTHAYVDLSGDSAIIGPSGVGDAFVYFRQGNSWSLQGTLPLNASDRSFGDDVSLQGNNVLVSGWLAADPATRYTALYVRSGDSGSPAGSLQLTADRSSCYPVLACPR